MALLEKLIGLKSVKKFPSFYGTRKFIISFTSARHLSLSWASSIQSIPPHPTSWRSILILSSHLRLDIQNSVFLQFTPPKSFIHISFPHTSYIPNRFHYPRFYNPKTFGRGVHITKLPCCLVPPRSKYSPNHPVLDTGFLGFRVSISKRSDGSQHSKLPRHASRVALPI